MRAKQFVTWVALPVFVLACGIGFYYNEAQAANVVVKALPEHKVLQLIEYSEEQRGRKLADIETGELELVYSEVKSDAAFYELVDKTSRHGVVLYCDAASNSLNIGYRGKLLRPNLEDYLDGFSILKIRKGSKAIYEADDNRPALFDTHESNNRLALALEDLKYEDQEDSIVFSLRYHSPTEQSIAGGYSPAFKIKDVRRALDKVSLKACDFVELADVPMAMSE